MPRQRGLSTVLWVVGALPACGGDGPRDAEQETPVATSAFGTSPADDGASEAGLTQKFDALGDGLAPPVECAIAVGGGSGGGGSLADLDFTYVWIANSSEGTVSKIDTRTRVEVGRYYTSPMEEDGDPSRTAVNPAGDVAVTSRAGGVTKVAAAVDRCEDFDQDGVITTSTGPTDVLPWGTDECVRWFAELPGGGATPINHQGPRPTAWDAGTADDACSRLWVGWWHMGQNRGYFRRLDGANGDVLDEVEVPEWDISTTSKSWGPYGGAVDADGSLWVLGWGGPLVRIDGVSLEVTRWETPVDSHPYGLALDAQGQPWMSGTAGRVLQFDPATEQFEQLVVPGSVGGRILRGFGIDRDGVAFVAANEPCGLIEVDLATMAVVTEWTLPDCETPVGVGVDVDGNVWVPDQTANVAFVLDRASGTVQSVGGLVRPYTYSDMTGAGLDLVVNPPG